MRNISKNTVILLLLTAILIAVGLFSFTVGRYPFSLSDLLSYLFAGQYTDENIPILIGQVRLPRISGALLAGGALAVSGAAYQGLFRNPMVSPDILGVSSGAGFGAALAIIFSMGVLGMQLSAFAMGLFAVVMALAMCRLIPFANDRILMLVLSGMIVSALFGALISLMKYVADSDSKLPDIVFWLMGSFANITMDEVKIVATVIVLAFIPLQLVSWQLNVLSFGDEEAKTLGVNTRRVRIIIICCSSLLTGSVIAVSGLVGWVGLIIPHLARFIVGSDHRLLLPASFLIGGTFMLIVDNLSRSVSSLEIPIGVITSLIGAPVFFMVLRMSKKKV